jgi:hypothetical protein
MGNKRIGDYLGAKLLPLVADTLKITPPVNPKERVRDGEVTRTAQVGGRD